MFQKFKRGVGLSRPLTPPEQKAADAIEDAGFPNYDLERSARHRRSRKEVRDAVWEAKQAAHPSLARRASQGALNLAQNTSRGALKLAQNTSQGALNLARRASQRASNYLWGRADPHLAAADAPDLQCSICLEDAIAGQAANSETEAVLVDCPAKHRFHRGCIKPWMNHASCPICRGKVTKVTAAKKGGGYRTRGRRTRSKSKSRRYPRKPHKTRKV